jgi:glutathione synthase
MAIENPDQFVLKPQREGGGMVQKKSNLETMNNKNSISQGQQFEGFSSFLGNNIYGEAIREVLSKEDGSRTQYVLMEKIRPPVLKNYIVQFHKNEIVEEDVVSEFGVFGVVIR